MSSPAGDASQSAQQAAARVEFHLTGFGEFHGVRHNPTEQLVGGALEKHLASHPLPANVSVASMTVLETSGEGARAELHKLRAQAAEKAKAVGAEGAAAEVAGPCYRVWLHFGVHAGSRQFALESTAYNCADFRCPDQRGWAPNNEPILPQCEAKEMCTALDLTSLRDVLEAAPLPDNMAVSEPAQPQRWCVCVSTDPGRFVCNWIYFNSLASLAPPSAECHELSLFVHVPAHDVYDLAQQTCFARHILVAIGEQLQQRHTSK